MWWIAAAGLALSVLGAITGSRAAKKQAQAQQEALRQQEAVDRANANLLDYRAADAIERGTQEQFSHGLKVAALEGTQRATFASRGVALDEGSALNVLMDTKFMGDLDRATIADNAAREAWALRYNANVMRKSAGYYGARASLENPNAAATASLLSGAGAVASNWYSMARPKYDTVDPW